MRAAHERYKDRGFTVLSVSVKEEDDVIQDFVARHDLTYPFLMDRDGRASLDFKVQSTPTTYFIDPDGVIVDMQADMMSRAWLERNISETTGT